MTDTPNVFFTADTHFFHSNIIRYCPDSRDRFENREEMNEHLIERWNEVVRPNDLVYHLGDVAFAKPAEVRSVLRRLNGRIVLVAGNHDKRLLRSHDFTSCFHEVNDRSYLEEKIAGELVVMSHYPIARWNKMYYGVVHLYGHCHSSYGYHMNALDVGVDARPNNDLTPWEWTELKEYLSKREGYVIRNASIDSMIST